MERRPAAGNSFFFSFKCHQNTGITKKRIHLHETKAEAQSSPRTAQLGGDGFGAGQMGLASTPGVPRLGQGQGMGLVEGVGEEQTNRDERGGKRDGAAEGREGEGERDLYKK